MLSTIVIFCLLQNIAYNLETIDADFNIKNISIYDLERKRIRHAQINIEEVLSAINESYRGKYYTSCIIAESDLFNDVNIPYYSIKRDYPVKFIVGNGCNPLRFDYVILGPIRKTWRFNLFERSRSIFNKDMHNFELIYSAEDVYVYKRIK